MGISTHILDTALGKPVAGVPVTLTQWQDTGWTLMNRASTDADGRVMHLLPADKQLCAGTYCARFEAATYYEAQGLDGFYPHIEIVFEVKDFDQHYHVPLLLTANGYTTYRGS